MAKLNVSIVIVTFESRESAITYLQETSLEYPMIIDKQRTLYHYCQMFHAGFWDIWGPLTWWAYLKELLKGNTPKRSSGDIHQRGGDVLIDNNGVVQLHHVGAGPSDRPSVESILKRVSESSNQKEQGEDS